MSRTKLKELLVNRQISLKKYALDIFTNFLNVALVCNFNFEVPWPLLQVQMVTKSQDVSVEQMEGG